MKNKLLIIGASGHGKVVADIAMKMNIWDDILFLDDNSNITSVMGLDVIGTTKDLYNYIDEFDIFVAIGNNDTRKRIHKELETANVRLPNLIHPKSIIGKDVVLGSGTVVMAGVVINSGTKIGKGCIINTGSTVDHDNCIENFVHISPGVHLAGTVKIGQETWIGIGGIVSNNVNITDNCIIGAGTVVIKDLIEPGTYIGSPARRIS